MDIKEIKTRNEVEENRVNRLQQKIIDTRLDIAASKIAIAFWESQLKEAKK